jgi:hypothetical protein
MPCLGAALAIYAGSARYAGLILKNPAAVRIGLVSYSLYLVHWPVIVFGQLWLYHPLSPFELAIAVVVSYATAELMYHYIEQPFRTGPAAQRFLPYGAMGAAAMLLVSVLAYTAKVDDGWSWRLPDDLRQVATENRRTSPEIVGSIGCQASCDFGNPGAPTILLVGDSHIDQYTKTLNRMAGDKYHFHLAYSPSCFFGATMISHPTPDLSPLCEQANAALHEWLKTNRPQAIIAAERWPGYRSILYKNGQTLKIDDPTALYSLMLHDIAALYAGFTGPVIVLAHTPSTTAQCFLKPRLAALRCPKVVPIEDDEVRAAFAAFRPTTTLNMTLVSPDEALCPNRLCNIRDGRGHPLYSDVVHVSVYGAALIVPKILSALHEASPRPPGVALGQQGSYPR